MEIEKEVKKVRLLICSWSKGLVAETFGNALKGKATAIVIHGETFGFTTVTQKLGYIYEVIGSGH